MIKIFLREHGTHNSGYSLDFEADLNDYSNADELTEDLFEFTREAIEEFDKDEDYFGTFEEWLITDYEFEKPFDYKIDEYENLQKLIDMNEALEELDDTEIKLINSLVNDSGWDFEDAIERVKNGDILYFEGSAKDWAVEMMDEGLISEEQIKSYFDYEAFARDMKLSGDVTEADDISYFND